MKLVLFFLMSCSAALAVTDVNDLVALCDAWLCDSNDACYDGAYDYDSSGSIDLKDYAQLAAQWEGVFTPPTNQAPVAADVNHVCHPYILSEITLDATDDGYPYGVILYYITELPQYGYLQDPASNYPVILPGQLPWVLRSRDKVNYLTDSTGSDSFTFCAWDVHLSSEPATVNISISNPEPNELYLSFESSGYVLADHNDYQNFRDGWGVSVFIKTRQYNGMLLSKRDANGKGWELGLRYGKLRIAAYSDSGIEISCYSSAPVNTGEWLQCSVLYDANVIQIAANKSTGINNEEQIAWGYYEIAPLADPNRYVCDAQLEIADGYDGSISRTRFFQNASGGMNWDIASSSLLFPRNSTEEVVSGLGLGMISNLRWMMNDGSGLTVTEDKAGLDATIYDGDGWHEPMRIYYTKPQITAVRNVSGDLPIRPKQTKGLKKVTRKHRLEE